MTTFIYSALGMLATSVLIAAVFAIPIVILALYARIKTRAESIGTKIYEPAPIDELPDPWLPITPERRYSLYIQQAYQIEDFAQKNSDSFEKAMIALSGGAFGLSISGLGLLKGKAIKLGILMPISWCFFALSLGLMLWAYQVSREAYDKQLTTLDRHYFEYSDEVNPLKDKPRQISSFAVWLFYGGLASMCLFALINWPCLLSR